MFWIHLFKKKEFFSLFLSRFKWFSVIFLILQSFLINSCTRSKEQKDLILLKVNQYTMTTKEFGALLLQKLSFFDPLSLKEEALIKNVKNKVVEDFILQVASAQWAKKNNVFVRKENLDKEIQAYLKSYKNELLFREALLKKGMSFKTWKKKIHFSLLQKLIYNKVVEKAPSLSEQEIKTYYKKNKKEFQSPATIRLRQIVTQTENEAKLILEQIKKGRSFQELAKKFSISPESKNGGDTGWVEKDLLPIFEKAFKIRIGQMSGIVKSSYGYHIYEVLDKRKKRILPFYEVKDKISKNLKQEKEQKAYSEWLEQQIKKLKITKNKDLIEKVKVSIEI